jgi:hypothetical protein
VHLHIGLLATALKVTVVAAATAEAKDVFKYCLFSNIS